MKALRKKCPYSELFWSAFSRIRTEYGEILWDIRISLYSVRMRKMRTRITPNTDTFYLSPYSVRMPENANKNNSKYGHFLRSEIIYEQFGNNSSAFSFPYICKSIINEYANKQNKKIKQCNCTMFVTIDDVLNDKSNFLGQVFSNTTRIAIIIFILVVQ